MQNLIKKVDFISDIQGAFYNGEYRYKNLLGGFYQIFMSMCWVLGLIYFSKDIYLRENPSIVYSTEYDRIPYERSYKNLEDFLVMISINDMITWAPFIDETIYEPRFITMSKINQQKGPSTSLKAVRCSEILGEYENYTIGIPTDRYYCLDTKHDKVTFKGTQTSPDSKFIKIGLHMCQNSTANNNHCKSQEEIDEKLQGSSFNLFFLNFKFENKNYEDIKDTFLDFHHSFYSNLYYKLVFVTLKQIQYIDDVGFFFEDVYNRDFYAVDNIKEVFNFSKQPDGKFLDFAINFGTGKETVRRNYKRIQTVIAEVGGLFKGIVLSSLVLKYFFMDRDVYNYLNYFIIATDNNANNNIVNKNLFKQKSVLKLSVKKNENVHHNLSEAKNINSSSQKNEQNMENMNINNNNNNIIHNNTSPKNNMINNNINELYSNWKPSNNFKIQEKNEIKEISNTMSARELRKNNNEFTERDDKLISNDLKFMVRNYLDQKEFLKTVIDFNLLKRILFDENQYLKFEEMSRDMSLMLQIMREKEVISYEILSSKIEKN